MIVPHYEWRRSEKNRFVLRSDFSIDLGRSFGACILSTRESDIGAIDGRELTVWAGFEWDGCTPSQLFDIPWLSVPSPASTAAPSLIHDILCQFHSAPGSLWDREFADNEFDRLLKANRFPLRPLYVAAVRLYRELAPATPISDFVHVQRLSN